MKIGLVLEGGGMRGLYTNGVLDCLMDNHFEADYVIGVSAGACSGVSYVSGQRGRSYRVNTGYVDDKRYVGFESLVKTKSMFGMDFIFDEIPNHLDPFDYEAFLASPMEFVTGVTDADTGRPVYFTKEAVRPGTAPCCAPPRRFRCFRPLWNSWGDATSTAAPPTRSRCRRRWTTAATGWSWC